jgi:hypothetical protein
MRYWLIPVDTALPEVDAFLDRQGDRPIETPEEMAEADALVRAFVRCSEELQLFVRRVGRTNRN